MAEGYTYAGPLMDQYYYYDDDESDYYHRIQKEGDRLFVGLNPTVGFEDAYFIAGVKNEAETGTISWDGNQTIMNGTQWDFPYFAVIKNNNLTVYKDLPSGERFSLDDPYEYNDTVATAGYYSGDSPAETYYYGYLRDSLRDGEKEDIDLKAALGMGISRACFEMDADKVIIVGVTENWNKTVDDDCSEVSYGCLYTIMEE